MNSQALVVLNLRNYLLPCARESFQDAADRWGADLVELTEPLSEDETTPPILWQKALVWKQPQVQKYERVLQLDGDMLIRRDCPSPFYWVHAKWFGAVCRLQPHHNRPRNRQLAWYSRRLKLRQPPARKHLNSGFLLYTLACHDGFLDEWAKAGKRLEWRKHGGTDQVALSVILFHDRCPLHLLSWQFNAVMAHSLPRRMTAWVYHFNGPAALRVKAMNACVWKET